MVLEENMYKKSLLDEIKNIYNKVNVYDDTMEKKLTLPSIDIFDHIMINDAYNNELQILGEEKLLKKDTGIVLLAGGGGTRVLESLKSLLKSLKDDEIDLLTEEEKKTVDMFKSINSINILETNETKLTLPITPIKGKSSMILNLESISSLARDFNKDLKVLIMVGPTTISAIKELLIENDNFGLQNIAIKIQGTLPCINQKTNDFILYQNGEYLSGANGGGGVFEALFSDVLKDAKDNIVYEGNAMEWFKDSQLDDILIAQTDDAKEKEVFKALLGTKQKADKNGNMNNLVGMAYRYPKKYKEIGGEIEFAFKLGSLWKVSQGKKSYYKILEFNDLSENERKIVIDNFKLESSILAANSGSYVLPIELSEKIYKEKLLELHLQKNKFEKGYKVTKFEYFLPDIVEIATKNDYNLSVLLLRDSSMLSGVLKDNSIDSMPIKDISKLSIAQEIKEYLDKKKLQDLGVKVHDDAIVEISNLASFTIGNDVVLKKDSKLYIGGSYEAYNISIGNNVTFEEGSIVIIEGNKDVTIDDGVVFKAYSTINL